MKKIYWFIVLLLVLSFLLFYNSKYFIKLNGEKEITINLNEQYIELGAKTLFNQNTKIEGKVDNTKIGDYIIKYYHLNNYIERKVAVVDKEPPVITLKGDSEVNLVVNGEYHEVGYTANDNYDKDITDKVKVINDLDTTKEGTYEIIYEVFFISLKKTFIYTINSY